MNVLIFVDHGDDGKCTYRCSCCRETCSIESPSPVYERNLNRFRYCWFCGVKFDKFDGSGIYKGWVRKAIARGIPDEVVSGFLYRRTNVPRFAVYEIKKDQTLLVAMFESRYLAVKAIRTMPTIGDDWFGRTCTITYKVETFL